MLGLITFATSVHLLRPADFPQELEIVSDYTVEPEDDILYTLSEVYLNSPETEYFHSVEHSPQYYFEDLEEDETWLLQPSENSVEIPKINTIADYEEIELELDEFDEQMEGTWLIDEMDDFYDVFDDHRSEEDAELSQEYPAVDIIMNTVQNSAEKEVLSDLKIQFKRLLDLGYLERSELVESLMNGAFDHLLEPKQTKTFKLDDNPVENPEPQQIPILPMPENSSRLFTPLKNRDPAKNDALEIFQRPQISDFNLPICNLELDKREINNIGNLVHHLEYNRKSLTPVHIKKSLSPSPVVSGSAKYPRPVESPAAQDFASVSDTLIDLINIDETTYGFVDVSEIRVFDLPTIGSESEEMGSEVVTQGDDSDQENYIKDADDNYIWQEDNWPEWDFNEDEDLYF